jgi:hypothetical protein
MTEPMIAADVSGLPYPSIDALRRAHKQLFETLPARDRNLSDADREKSAGFIETFIARAIATGAVLDAIADRREAQGSIDYWVASAYTKPRYRGAMPDARSKTDSQSNDSYERPDNQLEAFDPTVIDDAAEQGSRFIDGMPDEARDLARRILFRLIQFPDAGDQLGSLSASRDELQKFGDPEQIDKLLEGLKGAGILGVKFTDADAGKSQELLTLRYLALTRRWEWLSKEIKIRMNFRDMALSWVGCGRSSGALLDRSLTRRFREYSNLSAWETEFINESGRRVTKWTAAMSLAAILLVVGCLSVTWLFLQRFYGPRMVESANREIKDKTTSIPKKIDDIKWLSLYRQPINISGVELTGPEVKDLSGLFAPGAVFIGTRLSGVSFDTALLWGASFNLSVINRTSFAKASLPRARFEGAEFCENVDFTDADLQYTSFKRARFSNEYPPTFDKTAWWLAFGLGFDEISLLDRKYLRTSVRENTIFRNVLADVEKRIEQEKEPRARAIALNEKAWTLAILGLVSDGIAEREIREALRLIESLKQEDGSPDDLSNFGDTLAYILLQKSEEDPKRRAKNLDDAVARLAVAAKSEDGEVLFRYAVALHATNKETEARANLEKSLIEQQYDPSHELYLLGSYLTGDFKKRVADATGRTPRGLLPSRCPKDVKKAEDVLSTTRAAVGNRR